MDDTDVGYILSKYLRDSFKKFCNGQRESVKQLGSNVRTRYRTWMAVRAATMAGLPNPCVMSEKCVK